MHRDYSSANGKGHYHHVITKKQEMINILEFLEAEETESSHYCQCCTKLFWSKYRCLPPSFILFFSSLLYSNNLFLLFQKLQASV